LIISSTNKYSAHRFREQLHLLKDGGCNPLQNKAQATG